MGRIVIVAYKPKPGKESELEKLMEKHVEILRQESLATDRAPIIMRSSSKTILEVFEWKSKEAIAEAHANSAVKKLWIEFEEVCTYEQVSDLKEANDLFAEFEAIN